MADIKDQLIKDSYNYVLQSDLSTGVVYRIGGSIPVNPIFSSGLTVNSGFTYSNGTEQSGYALLTDGTGYAYWGPVSGSSSSVGDYLPLSGGTVTGDTIFTSGLTATTLTFDTITTITPSLATINWNQSDKTLEFGYGDGDTTIQIGQEMVYPPVVNKDSIDLVEGTLVMVDPTDVAQGNRLRVIRALTDGTYPSQLLVGILTEDIPRNNEGYATWFGYVRNLDIPTLESNGIKPVSETWVEGKILYPNPNTPGGLTINQPQAPAIDSTIAAITSINGNNLTLLVRPLLTVTLGELNDVSLNPISAITNTSVLSFSSSTGVWVDRNIVGNSGISVSSNSSSIDVSFTGGTITGSTNFTGGLTATTVSATTYYNLPFSGTINGNGITNYIPKWTGSTALGDSLIYDDGTNLGIGTTTPSSKLDIITPSSSSIGLRVSGSSSTDIVRITQTGSGNAFVVEDDTNPDSTPFVVAADGRVGIGITAPLSAYRLHVRNGAATSSAAASGTVGLFESSGNSYVSVVSPDANVAGFAYGSASNRTGTLFNWSYSLNRFALTTNNVGAYLWFGTNDQQERMRIDASGNTGINVTSPSEKLHVSGNTLIQGSLTANTISATTYYNLPVSAVTSGTGISASTSNGVVTITNTSPDQTVTINGGTDISVTGTYPDFTIDFTGTTGGGPTLVASNTCLIPADGSIYIGSSSVGWGYFQWDTPYENPIKPRNITNGIPLPKDVNTNDIIRVCGIAYCDASVPENDTLGVILSYFICGDLTVNSISQSGYTYERDGTVCFNLEATYTGRDTLVSCQTFLILGFSSSLSDASQIKISYTIKIE